MKSQLLTLLLLGAAAASAHAQAARPAPHDGTTAGVVAVQRVTTPAMADLQASAQRLRESIQILAQKPPGPDRKAALEQAQKALQRTQQAMADLPPEYRVVATQAGAAGDAPSVKIMMAAADSLRDSIHAMAGRPAGPQRNQAIRDANKALIDLQGAIANAYDLTAYQQPSTTTTTTIAVNQLRCEKVPGATLCH